VSQSAPELELDGVSKRFGATVAVDRLSFRLWPGEFLSLLGPSGCGKTTTLRMIAGFLVPDAGRVLCRGQDITREAPYRRDVGLVFQSYALFPHMTVAENVAFGLRMRRAGRTVIGERVRWALGLVRLSGYEDRRPHQLSGGQQQRVAVARVLGAGASLLLFDEPFSNLDAKLRKEMQVELRELQRRLGIATVHVTHDQEEAMTMSDRLAIMHEGRLVQEGTPAEIYRAPRSAFVADFMGRCNKLPGRVAGSTPATGAVRLALDVGGELEVPWAGPGPPPERAVAFVRPEHIAVGRPGSFGGQANVLSGTVRHRLYLGPGTTLTVTLDERLDVLVEFLNPPEGTREYEPGTKVDLRVPPASLRLLSED
jgi:ABC-type Fe3+/spermidine/putrescine transport system ATPase subunit